MFRSPHTSASIPAQSRRQRAAQRAMLLIGLSLSAALGGCEEPAPPPAAAPEKPEKSRAQLMAEAQAKMEALREQNRDKMRAVGIGKVTRLKRVKGKLEMTFAFENTGDKPLSAAEGAVAFFDGGDTPFKQLAIPFREPIAPGKTVTKKGLFPIDDKDEGDKKLAATKLADLTQKWMPKKYRFDDGTTMESD